MEKSESYPDSKSAYTAYLVYEREAGLLNTKLSRLRMEQEGKREYSELKAEYDALLKLREYVRGFEKEAFRAWLGMH